VGLSERHRPIEGERQRPIQRQKKRTRQRRTDRDRELVSKLERLNLIENAAAATIIIIIIIILYSINGNACVQQTRKR